jgi:hypothetical protein
MGEVYAHPALRDSPTAKEPGSAYRPLPKGLSLKDVFCLKEERTVAGDNIISYPGKTFQILSNEYRISFYKAKVEVHEYLDGSINIFYQGQRLKHKPIPQGGKIQSSSGFIEQTEKELVTMNY